MIYLSEPFEPFDPKSSRVPGPDGGRHEPDPEPIVRRVRAGFGMAAMLLVALLIAALHPLTAPAYTPEPNRVVTAVVAAIVTIVLMLAYHAMRPSRLIALGKQAARDDDRHSARTQPPARRGVQGLAMGWATQAMGYALLPALCGIGLMLLHRQATELLAFAAATLVAGLLLEQRVTRAVRLAAGDNELWTAYGGRG